MSMKHFFNVIRKCFNNFYRSTRRTGEDYSVHNKHAISLKSMQIILSVTIEGIAICYFEIAINGILQYAEKSLLTFLLPAKLP